MTPIFPELLWIFTQLPDDYVVLDIETTGLPDENGLPDIVSLGITVVKQREIQRTAELMTKPLKPISVEAQAIHGISYAEAVAFESFDSQWQLISGYLKGQLIITHNASFDWPILMDHVERNGLVLPQIQGVFCSQKAAIPWAQAMDIPCSHRGPSLDTLTKALGVEDLRVREDGLHGAKIDSRQLAQVLEVISRNENLEQLLIVNHRD